MGNCYTGQILKRLPWSTIENSTIKSRVEGVKLNPSYWGRDAKVYTREATSSKKAPLNPFLSQNAIYGKMSKLR